MHIGALNNVGERPDWGIQKRQHLYTFLLPLFRKKMATPSYSPTLLQSTLASSCDSNQFFGVLRSASGLESAKYNAT